MPESVFDDRADGVPNTTATHPALPDRSEPTVDPDELLSLLSDDYARSILKTISDEGRPARTIAERLELSRATVYRRLNRLQEAGVVDTTMAYHSEGHHRKHYHAVLDEVQLSFEDGDVAVTATMI